MQAFKKTSYSLYFQRVVKWLRGAHLPFVCIALDMQHTLPLLDFQLFKFRFSISQFNISFDQIEYLTLIRLLVFSFPNFLAWTSLKDWISRNVHLVQSFWNPPVLPEKPVNISNVRYILVYHWSRGPVK
jgi:hypothetical protein